MILRARQFAAVDRRCKGRVSKIPKLHPPVLFRLLLQGNVDPTVLFCGEAAIEAAVRDVLQKAGGRGHILNLGHGVLVGTPEEAVAHMFNLSKQIKAAELVTA